MCGVLCLVVGLYSAVVVGFVVAVWSVIALWVLVGSCDFGRVFSYVFFHVCCFFVCWEGSFYV